MEGAKETEDLEKANRRKAVGDFPEKKGGGKGTARWGKNQAPGSLGAGSPIFPARGLGGI